MQDEGLKQEMISQLLDEGLDISDINSIIEDMANYGILNA